MTDPIADLLTRIRNALMRGKKNVNAPYSKLKHELAMALVKEGLGNTLTTEILNLIKEV